MGVSLLVLALHRNGFGDAASLSLSDCSIHVDPLLFDFFRDHVSVLARS